MKDALFQIPTPAILEKIVAAIDALPLKKGSDQKGDLYEYLLSKVAVRVKTVHLKEISESVTYGHTASASTKDVGSKFLRITDIQGGRVNWDEVPFCLCPPKKLAQHKLQKGDIVFALTGATTGKSFLIGDCPVDSVFASYLIRVRPLTERVDSAFLCHYFDTPSYWGQIGSSSTGSTQPGVNATKLKKLNIPLPPLDEQRRIVKILNAAQGLIDQRKEQIALMDQLVQSLFYEMFGDPVSNPMGWPLVELKDVGSLKRGKSKHRPRNAPELLDGKHPLIQTGDVSKAGLYIHTYSQTYSDVGLKQSMMWPAGTLCITIAANIAKTTILGFDACFPDSIVAFIPSENSDNMYIQFWFGFLQ